MVEMPLTVDEVPIIVPTPTLLVPTITPTTEAPTPAPYRGDPTPHPPFYSEDEINRAPHVVRAGQTLSLISAEYDVPVEEILALNELESVEFLQSGQVIQVPVEVAGAGSAFKIIPDSELLYGPTVTDFDTGEYIRRFFPQSALLTYTESVEGRPLNGVGIVDLVAVRFSVNPRLLLAMVEHRTGWVTNSAPAANTNLFPMRFEKEGFNGLYTQLSWAANRLNFGYYGRLEAGVTSFVFENGDKRRIPFDPTINHGTAAVQNWLAADSQTSYALWQEEAGPNGFYATYSRLFGNPFGFTYAAPIVPDNLRQPSLTFPWEEGVPWYFTGGPHGGWAAGSAWAALDFAPDKDQRGCYVSQTWVTASAPGIVVYSDFGGILLDLDGDGDPGTGWVLVYWHIDSFERIPNGRLLNTGDRIGHASCEGGFSSGTHIHFARRYNGQWISADGRLPFILDGWISEGTGNEYDGFLVKDGKALEACVCAEADINEIIK